MRLCEKNSKPLGSPTIRMQRSNDVEEPDECRPHRFLLQVLSRQTRKNRLVYVILAERSLILSEAKAPQPDHDVHDGARASPCSISSCERHGEGPKRRGWEEKRKRQQALRAQTVGAKVSVEPSEVLINAAVAATVHDSSGCLPSRAERFRRIVRSRSVRMYEEHDALAQVLNRLVVTSVRTRRVCLTFTSSEASTPSPELDFNRT